MASSQASPDGPALKALRSVRAFAGLADADLAELLGAGVAVTFAPGQSIIRESEVDEAAYVLIEGEVVVLTESAHGEAVLARFGAPALVGEIAALTQAPRTASIRAVSAVRALRLARPALLEACRRNPEVLVQVVGQLARQLQGVNHALGLYAGGFAALEREDFDPGILDDLANPTSELRDFGEAFGRLARHIALERRKRTEMASAAVIQRAMLPQALAGIDGRGRCDVFGDMKPARDVGGDFYDVFMLDQNRMALVVGDVCGKGVPASLFMSITMTILRLAAKEGHDVGVTLQRANSLLYAQNPSALFATVVFGVLDLTSGRLDYGICGHNPPFLIRSDGTCSPLPGGGTPLGIFPDKTVRPQSTFIGPGETLFLYTDGVTESIDAAGAEFGEDRLAGILGGLAGASSVAVCRAVMGAVAGFASDVEQFDDITALAVRLMSAG